ncbi:MAG: zinc ribbon domain-containing protein [Acidobacteria bacterium]|nr:zinc ribbon domain-containing protein [Acidobacteriota bacterium]
MPPEVSALDKHHCPGCGAEAHWNAAKQALVCPYCGTVSPATLASDGSLVKEHDLALALRAIPDANRGWETDRTSVQCQSCKAISLFDAARVAQRCEFCGSASVVPYTKTRNVIYPESLLPFTITEAQVRESIRQWYASRWFAPNRLKKAALTDRVGGVYLPYWTFDARVHALWRAEAGHYYYETRTVTRNGRTETVQERRVRWVPAAGELSRVFDDTLVSATQGLHPALLRKIEPFPTKDLRPYDRGYVSGWVVEQYQIDLVGAAERSRAEMDAQVRDACGRDVPGDTYRNLEVAATYTDQTFKHTLLPVWLLHYDYGRKSYQVVVNGVTGTIAGEQPYSWIKIFFATLAFIIVALTLFVLMEQ